MQTPVGLTSLATNFSNGGLCPAGTVASASDGGHRIAHGWRLTGISSGATFCVSIEVYLRFLALSVLYRTAKIILEKLDVAHLCTLIGGLEL